MVLMCNAGEENLPLELNTSRIYQILQPVSSRDEKEETTADGMTLVR